MDTRPMSKKKRSFFLVFFVIIFILAVPLIILYSSGYGVNITKENGSWSLSIAKTGGVFVSVPDTGVTVDIGGEISKTTGIFQKDLYFDRLVPQKYLITVKKDGYYEWKKEVEVFPEKVAEAYPFVFAKGTTTIPIEQKILSTSGATTTNPLFTEVSLLFKAKFTAQATTTELKSSTTTLQIDPNLKSKKNFAVTFDDQGVLVTWIGDNDEIPFYFCDQTNQGKTCTKEKRIYSSGSVSNVDFYPGRDDLYVIASGKQVVIVELDNRPPQNFLTLYKGDKPDFLINSDKIYIKDGKLFFQSAI